MAKRSSRGFSKKILPAGIRRITENGKRVWKLGNAKFRTLRDILFNSPIGGEIIDGATKEV